MRCNNIFNPNLDVTSLERFSEGFYSNSFADCLDTNTLFCSADGGRAFSEHQGVVAWLCDRLGASISPAHEDALKIEYWAALRQKLRSTSLDLSEARKNWSIASQANRLKDFYRQCIEN